MPPRKHQYLQTLLDKVTLSSSSSEERAPRSRSCFEADDCAIVCVAPRARSSKEAEDGAIVCVAPCLLIQRRTLRPRTSSDNDCFFVKPAPKGFDFKSLRDLEFDEKPPVVDEPVPQSSDICILDGSTALAICDGTMAEPAEPPDDQLAAALESGDVSVGRGLYHIQPVRNPGTYCKEAIANTFEAVCPACPVSCAGGA